MQIHTYMQCTMSFIYIYIDDIYIYIYMYELYINETNVELCFHYWWLTEECLYSFVLWFYLFSIYIYVFKGAPNGLSGCSVPALLKDFGRCESLWNTTCLKTVVSGIRGMLPVKYFHSDKASLCVSWILWRLLVCHKIEVNMTTLSFDDVARFKAIVAVCIYIYVCIYI